MKRAEVRRSSSPDKQKGRTIQSLSAGRAYPALKSIRLSCPSEIMILGNKSAIDEALPNHQD
jgi:hypothetical protein